jgi:hypothetical protein
VLIAIRAELSISGGRGTKLPRAISLEWTIFVDQGYEVAFVSIVAELSQRHMDVLG